MNDDNLKIGKFDLPFLVRNDKVGYIFVDKTFQSDSKGFCIEGHTYQYLEKKQVVVDASECEIIG